jgi:RHS repeat-associated protein
VLTRSGTFAYDGAGNRTRLTHPNGTSTDYAYLNNHWLQSITDKVPGGATFQSVAYGYDQNGNRISQTDSSGTTTFAYDALNRLTQAAHPGGYGTWSWTYDAVGNRTQQTGPGGTTNYAYDQNNRLLSAGSTTYSYDQNGNLLTTSSGQTFSWDVFNRMTQATGSGGTVSYSYNGDGLKTRRVGPDGVRNYYYDGIRPIWETDSSGAMTAQLDRDIFGNLLSRRGGDGTRRYYHHDGLGSTTALTNETRAVAATMLYDAWGNQRAATGSDQGRYRFTGAEMDPTTGLYHMGARFYDPTIGRWLSEDPVAPDFFDPATLSFYAYTGNNPMLNIDPRGTQESNTSNNTNDEQKRAQEILERIARELGISLESLMSLLNEFLGWVEQNSSALGKAGAVLAAVAAALGILGAATTGGFITAGVVAAISAIAGAASIIAGMAAVLGAFGQMRQGKISGWVFAGVVATNALALAIPGAARIGRIASQSGPYTALQAYAIVGHIGRSAWGIIGLPFAWR